MSSWMNEPAASAVPNHNGNGFGAHLSDPSQAPGAMIDASAYMANPAQFNAAQFASPQQMMAMQNGAMRNASPSFSNPVYQTNSVIPSKRPRPREDSMAGSPRPAPGMAPTSRAETPQQGHFAGFPQQTPGQPPGAYPHLQPNGSANATPSPIMSNQMRPGSVPQRVSTTSPHPYSPGAANFGQQASPVPSDHGGTPQPNNFVQQGNFPQGFNQNFSQTPSPARPSPNSMAGQMLSQPMAPMPQQMVQTPQQMGQMFPGPMPQQMGQMFPGQMQPMQQMQQMPTARNPMEQQKLMFQMQLQRQYQQQQQQGNMQMAPQIQGQGMPQNRNMMPRPQVPNGQMPPGAMRPHQGQPMTPQQAMARGQQPTPEQFMEKLSQFMASKGLSLDPRPMAMDRPVNLWMLRQAVVKHGGYRNVMQHKMWPNISSSLGFHPVQVQMASGQLQAIYEQNLLRFEEAVSSNRAKQMQQQAQQQQQQQQQHQQHQQQQHPQQQQQQPPQQPQQHQQLQKMPQSPHPQQQQQGVPSMPHTPTQGTPTKPMPQGQMPPGHMMQPGQHPQMQHSQMPTPMKHMTGMPQPLVNGFSAQHMQAQPQPNSMPGNTRASLPRSVQGTPTQDEFSGQSTADGKGPRMSTTGPAHPGHGPKVEALPFPESLTLDPDMYRPIERPFGTKHDHTHGAYVDGAWDNLALSLLDVTPDIPPVEALGNIDLEALCRSIQSGIRAEVRLALDTLATVTVSRSPQSRLEIDITRCPELIECLIECAEDQIELLVENTVEVSDEILITPYEELTRAVYLESYSVRADAVYVMGSTEYELDRAVDRLICVTTIIRNLSFTEFNHPALADESVIKFFCVVIRYIGTRNMLLRTQANTLDFMKDTIIILSNISNCVEIPGREQALCLLQFILAFAPLPPPTLSSDQLYFPPYDPQHHSYLPAAVDALSKLLVSKEQNRTHFSNIYANEGTQSSPYELLTRSFGLAISPIPDPPEGKLVNLVAIVDLRKPTIMQGLLAAETIASLAPGHESGVARAWLTCSNDFAQNLFHLIRLLASSLEPPPNKPVNARNNRAKDPEMVSIVVLGISLLKQVSERARDPADPTTSIPPNVLPSRDTILGALQMKLMDWADQGLHKKMLEYAALEERGSLSFSS